MKRVTVLSAGLLLAACAPASELQQVQAAVEVCSPHPRAQHYPAQLERLLSDARGVEVTVEPITDNAYTEPSSRFTLPAGNMLDNPLVHEGRVREAREQLSATVRDWQAACGGQRNGAEILAAIKAAVERLPETGGTLVVISSGFEQSAALNLYDRRVRDVRGWLDAAGNAGWNVPLRNVRVCFTGVNDGDGQADSRLTTTVAAFWRAWVAENGGSLIGYGSDARCDLASPVTAGRS